MLKLGHREFDDDALLVMAIVNRTPDSFYDKGATWQEDKAFDRVRQVVAELRKVVWPTRPMVVSYFFVVLVFVLVMMAIVAGLDFGFGKAMFKIYA